MYNNLSIFTVSDISPQATLSKLFVPCLSRQEKSVGFISTCGQEDVLLVVDNNTSTTAYKVQSKIVSSQQVKDVVDEKIKLLPKRPSNIQIKAMRDEAKSDLLVHAPIRNNTTDVIFDQSNRRILIDTSNVKLAQEIIAELSVVSALPAYAVVPMSEVMTTWVLEQPTLEAMYIANECTIVGADDQNITIRGSIDIQSDAAEACDAGGYITSIGLAHNNGLSFRISENGAMSSIKGLDKDNSDDAVTRVSGDAVMMVEYADEIVFSLTKEFVK
jgi:DNA recombination-dependent growth factor C